MNRDEVPRESAMRICIVRKSRARARLGPSLSPVIFPDRKQDASPGEALQWENPDGSRSGESSTTITATPPITTITTTPTRKTAAAIRTAEPYFSHAPRDSVTVRPPHSDRDWQN
eukprot:593465-Pyramimonas_sp.AAC.1